MKTLPFSSVWSLLPYTLLRLLILLLLPSFSLWSSESSAGGLVRSIGIVGVHAAAYDLLPGDPAFIYDEGWVVPPEWNTTGNADAANGYNLTNITRIGTMNSGFHLTFQGEHLCIYGSENMVVEAWLNGQPVELDDPWNHSSAVSSSNVTSLTNATTLWGAPLKILNLDSDGEAYQLYLRVNGPTPDSPDAATSTDSANDGSGSGSSTDGSNGANGASELSWFGGVRILSSLPAVQPAFYGVDPEDTRHDHAWGTIANTTYMGLGQAMRDSNYNVSEGWNWMRDSYVTRNDSTIWSATEGSEIEIVFNGTAFWVFATLAPYTSVANVSIDWTERSILNMTHPEMATPVIGGLVWAKTELIPGTHCVRMQVLQGRVDFNFVRMVGHPVDPDEFYAIWANVTSHIPSLGSTDGDSPTLALWQIVLVAVVPSLFLAGVAFTLYSRRMKKLKKMSKAQDPTSSEVGILGEEKSTASSAQNSGPAPTLLRNSPARWELPTITTTPGIVVPYIMPNATGGLDNPNNSGGSGNLPQYGAAPRKGALPFPAGGAPGWSPVSPIDRERYRDDNTSLSYPDTIDDISDIRPLDQSHPSRRSPVHINVGDEAFRHGDSSGGSGNNNNRSDQTNSSGYPTREDERRHSPNRRAYQPDHLHLEFPFEQGDQHDHLDQHYWAVPPPSYPGLALSRNGSVLFTVRNEDGEYEEYSSSSRVDPIYGDGRPRISIEKHVFGFGRRMNAGIGPDAGEAISPSTSAGPSRAPQLQLSREELARLVNRIAQLRGGTSGAGPSGIGRNRSRRTDTDRDRDSSADEGDASSAASAGGSGVSRRGSGVAVGAVTEDSDRSADGHATAAEEVDPNDPVEALARQLVEMERTLWDGREAGDLPVDHGGTSDPSASIGPTGTSASNPSNTSSAPNTSNPSDPSNTSNTPNTSNAFSPSNDSSTSTHTPHDASASSPLENSENTKR